jgi:hypothetical protein
MLTVPSLGSAVSPSGAHLAILAGSNLEFYSIAARQFLIKIPLEHGGRTVDIKFINEATILSGSERGYMIFATMDKESEPFAIDLQGADSCEYSTLSVLKNLLTISRSIVLKNMVNSSLSGFCNRWQHADFFDRTGAIEMDNTASPPPLAPKETILSLSS